MKIIDAKLQVVEVPLPHPFPSTWNPGNPETKLFVTIAEIITDDGIHGYLPAAGGYLGHPHPPAGHRQGDHAGRGYQHWPRQRLPVRLPPLVRGGSRVGCTGQIRQPPHL